MSNAVIYHSPNGRLTGAVLDALDAFALLRDNGVAVRFYCIGLSSGDLNTLVCSRYKESDRLLECITVLASRIQLSWRRFNKVLIPYSAYRRVHFLLNAEECLVLPTQYLRYDHEKNAIKGAARGTFLLDPEQHPYKVSKRINYRKKIYFSALRHPGSLKQNVLLNSVSDHKAHSLNAIAEALRLCEPFDKAIALSYKRTPPSSPVEHWRPPIRDLFGQFSTYLYLPSLTHYDENPRLLFEAAWLEKKVVFGEGLCLDDPASVKWKAFQSDPSVFELDASDKLLDLIRSSQVE